jgi:hypothetical protein
MDAHFYSFQTIAIIPAFNEESRIGDVKKILVSNKSFSPGFICIILD